MDGYASVGAALILKRMKVTLNARPPKAIIGDTDILKDAPKEMLQAGYGDIIGKYSCLNDWKLSALINNEYFCIYMKSDGFIIIQRVDRVIDTLADVKKANNGTVFRAVICFASFL